MVRHKTLQAKINYYNLHILMIFQIFFGESEQQFSRNLGIILIEWSTPTLLRIYDTSYVHIVI